MSTCVGIFGPPGDQEVDALARRLEHRGAEPWIVDLGRFPGRGRLTWDQQGPRVDGRPLQQMQAAYLRRVDTDLPAHARYDHLPLPDPGSWTHQQTMQALAAARRNQVVRTALIQQLARRCPVINPPELQNLHRLKVHQLDRLRRAGLPVPAFAAGSAAAALEQVAREHLRRWSGVVDKPLAGIYKTHAWTPERHAAHPWTARPALLQRRIRGDTVRCYVLAGQLLAAARVVHGDTVDSSLSQTGTEPLASPPAAVARVAQDAARALGLEFCGLDLLLQRGSGEVFLIDCNLSPMFVNFSRATRCDVAGHLADHLLAVAARGQPRPPVLGLVDQAKLLLASDPDLARLLGRKPDPS